MKISQPRTALWDIGQTATLPCNAVVSCVSRCSNETLWFFFNTESQKYEQINMLLRPPRYSLARHALRIQGLRPNDTGVYHCAVTLGGLGRPGAQEIGPGTSLLVRDMLVDWSALLWSLFVLLALYSLAVLVLVIWKKSGQEITVCRKRFPTSDEENSETRQKDKAKRGQFRAVVQELYGRRKALNPKSSGPQRVKGPQSKPPTDNIYQNL